MIDALVSGRLLGTSQRRTAKNGNPYATAKLRVPMANGESAFVNVIAFSDRAITALLALDAGDSLAISGELKLGTYTDKDGAVRPSLDLIAHAVLTVYDVVRKRKAAAGAEDQQARSTAREVCDDTL